MNDSLEPSPFAAFAVPKRSAKDLFQERQIRAARVRRWMIGCVLSCLVGAVGGSTGSAAFEGNIETVLVAAVGSLAGGFLGVPAGFILGGICFSVMSLSSSRGRPAVESERSGRDPMSRLRGLLFVWCLIAVAIGAAVGALLGAHEACGIALEKSFARRTMFGSLAGGGFALALYSLKSLTPRQAEPA